jgi:hypothetical protein
VPDVIPPDVRRQVLERDRVCARCGRDPGYDPHVHHRVLKGSGGTKRLDDAVLLVLLCGLCHALVHSRRHDVGEPGGWIVSRYADPADVPVQHFALGAVFLTPDYRLEQVRPEPLSNV